MGTDFDDPRVDKVNFWPGNPISYTTTRIQLYVGDTEVGIGTGFVLQYANEYALVTNWHVLSGRSPIDGKCLSKTGAIPTKAKFHVALVKSKTKGGKLSELIHFLPIEAPLYSGENGDTPTWFDEREGNDHTDIAVVPLWPLIPELNDAFYSLRCIVGGKVTLKRDVKPGPNVPADGVSHYYPAVGRQVFIVGYPAGIERRSIFPIWKGGTIASEPLIGLTLAGRSTEDAFLVDGLTRSGMSGAPVVCLTTKGEKLQTRDGVQVTIKKDEPYLLGVYAGREGVTPQEADLALGRVWKVEALERIFGRAILETKRMAAHESHAV